MASAAASPPESALQPVLGDDGKPLSPKTSTTYNEDVVAFTDSDGNQKRAVVTVSSPHPPTPSPAET